MFVDEQVTEENDATSPSLARNQHLMQWQAGYAAKFCTA